MEDSQYLTPEQEKFLQKQHASLQLKLSCLHNNIFEKGLKRIRYENKESFY